MKPLTTQQARVLAMFGNGYRTAQIAYECGMTEFNVIGLTRRLREKVGARTITQIVAMAVASEQLILRHDGVIVVPEDRQIAA